MPWLDSASSIWLSLGSTVFGERFTIFWIAMLGFFIPGLAWMVDLTPPGYIVSVPIMAALMAGPVALTRPGPTTALGFPARAPAR